MNRTLRSCIILGILFISISISYYFLIRPILKDRGLKKCIGISVNQRNTRNQEIKNKIQSLYSQRSAKESEKQEVEKQEKELINSMDMDKKLDTKNELAGLRHEIDVLNQQIKNIPSSKEITDKLTDKLKEDKDECFKIY